jgi:hypothetical protein
MKAQGRESAIPWPGHLSLALRRVELQRNLQYQLCELAREADEPLPSKAPGGDPVRLRGVPVCGAPGVSSTMRGTSPLGALLAKSDRLAVTMAVLGRDLPGTSPGTEPLQAVLDAEEAAELTAELLARKGKLERGADLGDA